MQLAVCKAGDTRKLLMWPNLMATVTRFHIPRNHVCRWSTRMLSSVCLLPPTKPLHTQLHQDKLHCWKGRHGQAMPVNDDDSKVTISDSSQDNLHIAEAWWLVEGDDNKKLISSMFREVDYQLISIGEMKSTMEVMGGDGGIICEWQGFPRWIDRERQCYHQLARQKQCLKKFAGHSGEVHIVDGETAEVKVPAVCELSWTMDNMKGFFQLQGC